MKTLSKPVTNISKSHVSFPFNDKRGRAIGALIVTYEEEYVEAPADACTYWNQKAGNYFHALVQSTRNGEGYGASQAGKLFETVEARDAYIAKRLQASEKAAAKLAAK